LTPTPAGNFSSPPVRGFFAGTSLSLGILFRLAPIADRIMVGLSVLGSRDADTITKFQSAEESNAAEAAQGRGYRFWLVFFALCVSAAVIAIEIVRAL
jgi:hypothetical protein